MVGKFKYWLQLQRDKRKYHKLGFHVVVVQANPTYIPRRPYGVVLGRPRKKVAILFSMPYECSLRGFDVYGYHNAFAKVPIGRKVSPTQYPKTGITFDNSSPFSYLEIWGSLCYPRRADAISVHYED